MENSFLVRVILEEGLVPGLTAKVFLFPNTTTGAACLRTVAQRLSIPDPGNLVLALPQNTDHSPSQRLHGTSSFVRMDMSLVDQFPGLPSRAKIEVMLQHSRSAAATAAAASSASSPRAAAKDGIPSQDLALMPVSEALRRKPGIYGKLEKRNETSMGWKVKFVVVFEAQLLYYDSETAERPSAVLSLRSACASRVSSGARQYTFALQTHERAYTFSCPSNEEVEEWLRHIRIAQMDCARLHERNLSVYCWGQASAAQLAHLGADVVRTPSQVWCMRNNFQESDHNAPFVKAGMNANFLWVGSCLMGWGGPDSALSMGAASVARTAPGPVPGLASLEASDLAIAGHQALATLHDNGIQRVFAFSKEHALTEVSSCSSLGIMRASFQQDGTCFGIDAEGGLHSWSLAEKDETPTIFPVLLPMRVSQVSCGVAFTCVLTEEGQVYSWGEGRDGQLGHGSYESIAFPQQIASFRDTIVVQVACGAYHAGALLREDIVALWGNNDYGQLGNGSTERASTPAPVWSLQGFLVGRLSLGARHSACIMRTGELFTWGCAKYGMLGHPGEDTDARETVPRLVRGLLGRSVADVSFGAAHSIALTGIATCTAGRCVGEHERTRVKRSTNARRDPEHAVRTQATIVHTPVVPQETTRGLASSVQQQNAGAQSLPPAGETQAPPPHEIGTEAAAARAERVRAPLAPSRSTVDPETRFPSIAATSNPEVEKRVLPEDDQNVPGDRARLPAGRWQDDAASVACASAAVPPRSADSGAMQDHAGTLLSSTVESEETGTCHGSLQPADANADRSAEEERPVYPLAALQDTENLPEGVDPRCKEVRVPVANGS